MRQRQGLLEIRLKNYKSIARAALALDPLTILVGPNGAGKSNVVDSLRLLADAMDLQLPAAIDAHGGLEAVRRRTAGARRPPRFGISVHMHFEQRDEEGDLQWDTHYGFEAKAMPNRGYAITRERCLTKGLIPFSVFPTWFDRTPDGVRSDQKAPDELWNWPKVEEDALLLPIMSGLPLYSDIRDALASLSTCSIVPRRIADLQEPSAGHIVAGDGRNVASVIQEMERSRPDDYRWLCELLGRVVPGIRAVTAVRYGTKLGLRFTQQTRDDLPPLTHEAASMSDGSLRVVGILAAVLQSPSPLLIAIEEPEASIHPGALGTLMDILRIGEHRSQLLITTHSPDILDSKDLDPASVRLVRWQDGVTVLSPLGPGSIDVLRDRLTTVGELLRANSLEPAEEASPGEIDLFPVVPGVSK